MFDSYRTYNIPSDQILEGLDDMANHGVHIHNSRVGCIVCGRRIPLEYSTTRSIVGTCSQQCTDTWKSKAVFNERTMWVVKWLSKTDTYSAFHVIVKIDGKLYFAENFISRWQLIDFETGKVVPDGLIWIGHNEIYAAYDKQALVRPKESVYMVQVTLSNLVRKVTADLSNTANWASTYTLTELVGSQPFQYHWIRLYLSPVERSEKNFVLRDIQLVASTDEPNLEKYFVTRLRNGKVQVTWSQVQQLVLGALGAIDSRSLQREIQENANRYKVIQSHVSSDAWIVLDLGFYFFSTDRNDPFHEVEDVSILPFPAG